MMAFFWKDTAKICLRKIEIIRGWGVVIVYFSKHVIVKPRTDLDFDSEAIWLEIDFHAYKIPLCVVYRQPNAY